MNTPTRKNMITLPHEEFEELLERAAERGAGRILTYLGLENGKAAHDIRELRNLLDAWRDARRTAWRTVIKLATTGVLVSLLLGAAIKFKILGLIDGTGK